MNNGQYTLKELIDFNNARARELESDILGGKFIPNNMLMLIQIRYFLSQIRMMNRSGME